MLRWGYARALMPSVVFVALGALSSASAAQPLAKEACDAAQVEHQALVQAGIPDLVKKGPAWTQANHGTAKMKDVQRYIGLQEQLLFRCGHAKLRNLPGAEGEEGGATASGANDTVASPPSPPAATKTKGAVAATKSGASKPRPQETGTPVKASEKPKPKPKPKAKVDDAYRPPPAASPAAKE